MGDVEDRFKRLFRGDDSKHVVCNVAKGTYYMVAKPPDYSGHLSGACSIAVTPVTSSGVAYFGAIDIDVHGDGLLDMGAIADSVLREGLPLVPTKTKRGGAHLYLFLKEPQPAAMVRSILKEWSAAIGFPGVEIFPKQDSIGGSNKGNVINLPYYEGGHTSRSAYRDGRALTLLEFVDYAESLAVPSDVFNKLSGNVHEDAPPCIQHIMREPPPEGLRNEAAYNISVYLKKRWPEDKDKAKTILVSWNTKMPEPLGHKELFSTLDSIYRRNLGYKCTKPPICDVCDRTECRGRKYAADFLQLPEAIGGFQPSVSRIKTNPVSWKLRFTADEDDYVILDTDGLLTLRAVKMARLEKSKRPLPPMSQADWGTMVEALIIDSDDEDVPDDLGMAGSVKVFLGEFLGRVPVKACTTPEDRVRLSGGVPIAIRYPDELGPWHVVFRFSDFERYIVRQGSAVGKANMVDLLKLLGAFPTRVRVDKKVVRVWALDPSGPKVHDLAMGVDDGNDIDQALLGAQEF